MDLRRMARDERGDLADFLATLSDEQWETGSLCTGWRVRDVVAHMISYDELTLAELLRRMARGGFRLSGTNALGVRDYSRLDPDALVALIRAHLTPRGLTAALGGMIGLLDAVIHHQDIRRPLGLPREIPEERLYAALRYSLRAPPTGAPFRARGLRLTATDIVWSTGRGPEIRGPGEALLLGISGRAAALPELTGPGLPVLTRRVH